jgi:hypothetical protein
MINAKYNLRLMSRRLTQVMGKLNKVAEKGDKNIM